MEWERVRAELAKLRREQKPKMSQTRLGQVAGIAKSTVNRIENVYGEPDHVPDLDTIERWVLATGLTLSSFFARIEQHAGHESGIRKIGGAPRDRPVPSVAPPAPDYAAMGRALYDVVHGVVREQTSTARPPRPRARPRDRKAR